MSKPVVRPLYPPLKGVKDGAPENPVWELRFDLRESHNSFARNRPDETQTLGHRPCISTPSVRSMPLKMRVAHEIKLLAYIIGLAAILSAGMIALPPRYADRVDWKWVRFILATLVLVVVSIRSYWHHLRKSLLFWALLIGFWLLHVIGIGYLVRASTDKDVPLGGFAVVGVPEYVCFALVVYYFFRVGPRLNRH